MRGSAVKKPLINAYIPNKLAWYAAEQRLRNQLERSYDVKMDFTIDELNRKLPGSGVDSAPVVELRSFLAN